MTSRKLALLLFAAVLGLGSPPALAQNYGVKSATTVKPQSTARTAAQTKILIRRTRQREAAEQEKRRASVRYTDPRATTVEINTRGSRLTSDQGSYSAPVQSSDNRGILVPQR